MTDGPAADDLPCVQVVQWITDYLEGALPASEAARLEDHLTECDGCTVVLDQFRVTIDATGAIGRQDVDAVDPRTRDELLGAFRQWAEERRA